MTPDIDCTDDPYTLNRLSLEHMSRHQEAISHLATIHRRSVAALYAQGRTYANLGQLIGLSTPRIGQLLKEAGPHVVNAFKAWNLVGPRLEDIADTTSAALEILCDCAQFDRQALSDLRGLVADYQQLLHGGEFTSSDARQFVESATYLAAVLVIWQRSVGEHGGGVI